MEKKKEPDLIDRIADALPSDELRIAYYREMRHLRSLPENDELLRILRAMQFLTLMTEQIPHRVLTEREKLETICREAITTAERLERVGKDYYQQLDKKLTRLPVEISSGINPKTIVERINDNLKNQFTLSTIPIVAKELAANAETIKRATKEYTRASTELCDSWRTTADEAKNTINKIETAISGAVEASEKAALDFSDTFRETYKKALWILIAMALVTEIMIVLVIFGYIRPQTKTVYAIPSEILLMMEQQKERERIPVP